MCAACSGCPFLFFFPSHSLVLYQYYDLELVSIATIQSLGLGPYFTTFFVAIKELFLHISLCITHVMRKNYERVTLKCFFETTEGKTGEEIQNCEIAGQRVPNESNFRHIGTQTFKGLPGQFLVYPFSTAVNHPFLRRRDGSSSFLPLAFEEISIDSGPLR